MRPIATAAIALAGLIHLGIAPEHYAHAPAHGVFFVEWASFGISHATAPLLPALGPQEEHLPIVLHFEKGEEIPVDVEVRQP